MSIYLVVPLAVPAWPGWKKGTEQTLSSLVLVVQGLVSIGGRGWLGELEVGD